MKTYISNIKETISTFSQGLKLTMRHMFQARTMRDPIGIKDDNYFEKQEGIVTLQYPFEELPVPDNGRYQLHNEIDDCIVCDKCAKVCPVNCIDIEPIKAVEEIGKTSDGTPKRIYAAKFDIDMAKCCFCGLCTTVCPTECLTMTKEFDFSVFDVKEHNFVFGEMAEEEITAKKDELEKFNEQKQKEKEAKATIVAAATDVIEGSEEPKKSVFKPKVKPLSTKTDGEAKKPVFKPKVKTVSSEENKPARPVFRPKIKTETENLGNNQSTPEADKPKKPVFRPKMKTKSSTEEEQGSKADENPEEKAKPVKPVFRPKIKPKK